MEAVAGFRFRAVLFRMVPKQRLTSTQLKLSFRAVLFRMVPKPDAQDNGVTQSFRAVLFRMVPKHIKSYSFFK